VPELPAILVEDLWKRYVILHERATNIKDAVLKIRRRAPREERFALQGVSFQVDPGEAVGVIGPNGSGKTTLLGVLAGVLEPTSGRVAVNGRVAALLEAGAGFHPDLTGLENIRLNAALLGIPRRAMDRRLDAILEFAGATELIDAPLRTYSLGMYARLALAVITHSDLAVLLLDEILAVGDETFHYQCYQRLEELRRQGCTVVFVSHILDQVRHICDRVIWLDQGRVIRDGPTEPVLAEYMRHSDELAEQADRATHPDD